MNKRRLALLVGAGVIIIAGLFIWQLAFNTGPPVQKTPFEESFDSAGTWITGDDATAQGKVTEGVYEMFVELSGDVFWVTAGQNFGDGTYEVEATPIEGTIDNGYGMLFKVDSDDQLFYIFKVSSDGYVFVGRCEENCAQVEALVDQDWFASPAVNQGLEVTNKLRVVADGSQMTFFVNESQVGEVVDETLKTGDIGLLAETFTPGGLRVAFDNFRVMPIEDN